MASFFEKNVLRPHLLNESVEIHYGCMYRGKNDRPPAAGTGENSASP